MQRVVFFGTPKIAKIVLSEIYCSPNIEVVGVFCQPDKMMDRKGKIIYGEVKQFALDNNLPLFQPENINHDFDNLVALKPDIIITCAYGQFIGEKILSLPKYKCINFHASLLPCLRGGAPIHWAIINGYSQTGWTLMFMEKKMDAGNIIKKYPIDISLTDTYTTLYDKLCGMIPDIIKNDLMSLFDDNLQGVVQNEAEVTFGYNIKKEETYIDFSKPALVIYNLIRGLNDKPVARCVYHHEEIKIYEACIIKENNSVASGTILDISKHGIKVATGEESLLITKLQLPSKKVMEVKDLINGHHPFKIGEIIE